MLLRLRRPWNDGTRAILFEPIELLEKLAALIPKPRINLLVYHGIFGPNARGRSSAVRAAHAGRRQSGMARTGDEQRGDRIATEAPPADGGKRTAAQPPDSHDAPETGAEPMAASAAQHPRTGYTRPKRHSWADLLSRTFQIDVLACPGCGGRLRLIATIEHRAVIEKILRYLGLSGELPKPAPPRQPSWLPGFEPPGEPASGWPD